MEKASTVDEKSCKRPRLDISPSRKQLLVVEVPTIDLRRNRDNHQNGTGCHDDTLLSIADVYQTHQAVFLPGYIDYMEEMKEQRTQRDAADADNQTESPMKATAILHWKDLYGIFTKLSEKDKESFCIENTESQIKHASPHYFLKSDTHDVGYCSFLVQQQESLSRVLEMLPVLSLQDESICSNAGALENSSTKSEIPAAKCTCCRCWKYEPCLWIFFGRNPSEKEVAESTDKSLQGRPEHTDSISHDGTWHYQLSGTKQWLLRPTRQLWNQLNGTNEDDPESIPITPVSIECHQGDVLIVNTKLWHHQTLLPLQPRPSVSYARDFWIICSPSTTAEGASQQNSTGSGAGMMTNVDGLYATDEIPEGTIIFREDEMPNCELHRSTTNPNCEVAELEDGTQAVVSIRPIAAGEFFCIGESSDEGEDDEEQEWEEEGWENGEE
ncbi:hypothetical protein IV203_010455 [Nitzschia inconspicua]|uniref:JmjC domain-containing protein n=1 Tax=Nitzschia inconspicua TaxID=303405 RepID=A0A9K3KW55_9STRA|nr:hypothetical protein IV203_010455 [Nitzschia inconspicua]